MTPETIIILPYAISLDTSADFTVVAASPLIVTSYDPTGDVVMLIKTDNVAMEDIEGFNVTLELTGRYPLTSFTVARNEFFVNHIQVCIEDRTGINISFFLSYDVCYNNSILWTIYSYQYIPKHPGELWKEGTGLVEICIWRDCA